ncbi:pseudoazurin [Niveispirillum fermenti]|uniref:pseudoazurin n=1 Tax=Niveispirillum fermenti TaxID=1233113 RepID=UPI003A881EF8
MRLLLLFLAFFANALSLSAASAAQHEIKALNKGTDGMMVFEPALIRAAPGDTITFTITDKGHNAQAITGLLPPGAETFAGEINKSYTITVKAPGLYGVECKPHYPMGMVALIVVGDGKVNLDAVKAAKLPGKAKERMGKLLTEAGY